jgi:hypothetical protein
MDYTQIILTFLALLGAIITTVIVPWIRRKLSESQQSNLEFYLRILVAAAETAFKDEGAGAEKKQWVIDRLSEYGIRFDVDLVSDAIEAMVRELTASGVINN